MQDLHDGLPISLDLSIIAMSLLLRQLLLLNFNCCAADEDRKSEANKTLFELENYQQLSVVNKKLPDRMWWYLG